VDRLGNMAETFYTGLLVVASLSITGYASYMVYKLFKGQA
jgi:hypothetical protein